MLRTNDGNFEFLVQSVEIVSQNAACYLRVVAQPQQILSSQHGALRRARTWMLDGVGVPMLARSVSLDQRNPERPSIIVNLLIPFANPIPVTIGTRPEEPSVLIERYPDENDNFVEQPIELNDAGVEIKKPPKKKKRKKELPKTLLNPRKLDVDGL